MTNNDRRTGVKTQPQVLIADDEVLIRDLVEGVLLEAGYEVTAAGTGAEAMAVLEKAPAFMGLVTDVNFGGPPKGWEVAMRAREINPNIAVIYMTGESAHDWRARGVPQSAVVPKPFDPWQIAVAIANLLNCKEALGRA